MTSTQLDLSGQALEYRLGPFLERHWQRRVRLSGWKRYPAGFSWITIGFLASFADGEGEPPLHLILRIGDPSGLLAPYRAEPEFRALAAVRGVAGLPVPQVHAYSDDSAVLGAPFLVTSKVEGDPPAPWKGAAEQRGEQRNASLAADFVTGLASLHAVRWQDTGLRALWGDVDRETVGAQQAHYWWRHAGFDRDAAGSPPQMYHAMRWLLRHAPAAPRVAIVHGDYRVGNFLEREGRITAVLDWELVHAGDPHEDLAWAALRIFSGGTGRVGGLMDRAAFFSDYARLAGFTPDPGALRYYEVLGLFKSASMLLSASERIGSGRGRDIRMASMGFQVASTLLEMNRLIAEAE